MISTVLAISRLARALGRALRQEQSRALVLVTAVVIAGGTLFYTTHEGWSPIDALYFTVTTLMTIGGGELTPTTALSKAFTIIYALVGIGLMASTIAVLAAATLEDEREHRLRRLESAVRRDLAP